jgi:hypothetical protein
MLAQAKFAEAVEVYRENLARKTRKLGADHSIAWHGIA